MITSYKHFLGVIVEYMCSNWPLIFLFMLKVSSLYYAHDFSLNHLHKMQPIIHIELSEEFDYISLLM